MNAEREEAHSSVGDESNALESASVREAHHIQVLNLATEAPVLANCIHLLTAATLCTHDHRINASQPVMRKVCTKQAAPSILNTGRY